MQTAIYFHDIFVEHQTSTGHPESSNRLPTIIQQLKTDDLWEGNNQQITRQATRAEIEMIHDAEYVDRIIDACAAGTTQLDPDTWVSSKSYEATRYAIGGALQAVDEVMRGAAQNAFCIVRPPGHHAERNQSMGFCLFNSVAVAAKYLLKTYDIEHVLIIDWDVHHGNGTQHSFYDQSNVFFLSFHQAPLFPNTGKTEEVGIEAGIGTTKNVVFPPHTDAEIYLERFYVEVEKAFTYFHPDFVLLSAGFDAHKSDPLAEQMLSSSDYHAMTKCVMRHANASCNDRIVSILEGGYDLLALSKSVSQHVRALLNLK